MAATHTGMTTEEFEKIVSEWIATAQHPRFKRRYTDLVFQPMLELMTYLRANGFKTYIVSGGGIEFMSPLTERTYGRSAGRGRWKQRSERTRGDGAGGGPDRRIGLGRGRREGQEG